MTEPLFRFLVMRSPIAEDPAKGGPLQLSQDTPFQKSLTTAANSQTARDDLLNVSKAFIASDKFVKVPDGTPFQKKVVDFSANIDKVEATTKPLHFQDVTVVVKQVFGQDAKDLIKATDFITLLTNLRDTVVAIKYVQEEHRRPISALTDQLRDLELIVKAVAQSTASAAVESTDKIPEIQARSFVAQWDSEVDYHVGDRVAYNGVTWECLQAHHSLSTWIPPDSPSLWKRITGPAEPTRPDPTPVEPVQPKVELTLYRKRALLLPLDSDLPPVIASPADEQKKFEDARRAAEKKAEEDAKNLLKTYGDVKETVDRLVKLSPDQLDIKPVQSSAAVDVDSKYMRNSLLTSQLDYRSSLRSVALSRSGEPAPVSVANVTEARASASTTAGTDQPQVLLEPTGAFGLAKDLLASTAVLQPKPSWSPLLAADRTPRMKASTIDTLGDTAKKVLSDRNIDIQSAPINQIVARLRRELTSVLDSLKELAPSGENTSYTRLGDTYIASKTPIFSQATSLLYGIKAPVSANALPALPLDGRVPHTKGKGAPAGVADLLVVKQTLKGYSGADVGHVENVLKGESKQRSFTKTSRTEINITSETETNTSEENELTSTTRFEMSKESANTLKEDESLKGELKVSAKYGPAVSVDASVEGSISRNKEEVNKAASKFSQDVTQRAAKKIAERILQKQSTTTITEVVEKDDHSLNNGNGTGHISGVYQWINKVYEAQVFNYGLRMMFEFMIPEPAAFLTEVLSSPAKSAQTNLLLEKPVDFTLQPSDIKEESIGNWITKYQATDVLPPPDDYTTVSDTVKLGGGDDKTNYDHNALLSIGAGYEAIYATISVVGNTWDDNSSCDVTVGSEGNRLKNPGNISWGTSIVNHVQNQHVATGGSIPWAVNTFNVSDCAVTLEVLCRITTRRMQQWQNETHAKLLTAYKARMLEYEEKLARLKLDTGITIEGTNPTANLITIKSELKKNCISVLTAQHFDLFNSISKNPSWGFPEINLFEAEAEGAYVRFFEQAFEWDQIMYITYPYFWGRMNTWITKLTINDPDPVFDEFLKAGFARVVVPARPGFEGAIDHFMEFGEIWNGGPLPPITSKLYVPIADEIAERTGKPLGEVPQGEAWDVVLPTTLLKLRRDDKLPTWHKDGDGKWVPDVEV